MRLADALLAAEERPRGRLRPREEEVLNLLAEGLTPTEAAVRLRLSLGTVSSYIRDAKKALGARTTAQAVLFSRKQKAP